MTAFGEGHSGEATGSGEVLVDVEGIEGSVEGAEAGRAAQAALDGGHQGVEVTDVGLVEGLGEFGQDEFTPVLHLGGDEAGAIAPVVFTDFQVFGGEGVGQRCGPGFDGRLAGGLVMLALATQAAIGIAGWLTLLGIATVLDVGFWVVLLDPGDDEFGVEGDAIAEVGSLIAQFGAEQAHRVVEEKLQGGVGQDP